MRFWILPSDSQYFRAPGAETATTNQVYRYIYIYTPFSKVCAGVCTQLTGSLWISSPCWPKIHNVGHLPPLWLISGKSYKLFSSSSACIWQPFWCWASVQGCIHFENALQLLVLLPFHGDFHLKPRRNWTQVRPMKQRRLPKQLSSPIHPASREKNQAFEQSVESQHCPYPKINVLFTEEHGYILTGCKHDLCSHIQQSFFPPNLGKKCLFTSLNHTLLQSMEMKVAENWQHDWMTESAETLQQPTQIETTNGCKHSDTNLTSQTSPKKQLWTLAKPARQTLVVADPAQ